METNQTPEEILSKHTGETGIYLTRGLIRGSDALEAMEEHSQSLQSEIERLKEIISGKTFNCDSCNSMTERNRELEEREKLIFKTFGEFCESISKQLLSNKQD